MSSQKAFERYARTIWPVQRLWSGEMLSRRCKGCALSSRCESIDQGGLCRLCQEYSPKNENEPADKWESLCRRMGAAVPAHWFAVVMVSGGKDSAWLLDKVANAFPHMRILGLQVDNGFLPDVAVRNAQHACNITSCDYILLRPPSEYFASRFRTAFRRALSRGCSGEVDFVDGDTIHSIGFDFARRNKVPFLISGVSRDQVQNIFNAKDSIVPQVVLTSGLRSMGEKDCPEFICPYVMWNKSEDDIIAEAQSAGLLPAGSDPINTNSGLITLMGVVDVLNIGYSSFEPEFCRMIRAGKADKKKWERIFSLLEYCASTGFLVKRDVKETIESLGLTAAELNIPWL